MADVFDDLPEEMDGELDEEEDPEALKAKLAELDAEAEKLKKDASKMEEEIKGDKAGASGSKEEADSRSVYVGNVRMWKCPLARVYIHMCVCMCVCLGGDYHDAFRTPTNSALRTPCACLRHVRESGVRPGDGHEINCLCMILPRGIVSEFIRSNPHSLCFVARHSCASPGRLRNEARRASGALQGLRRREPRDHPDR